MSCRAVPCELFDIPTDYLFVNNKIANEENSIRCGDARVKRDPKLEQTGARKVTSYCSDVTSCN